MKGFIPEETIQEIKRRVDIVAVISEHLTLRKAGRNYVGLCPFHEEKTPSFTVSPDKQMFYCFGCGASGQVFNFLMRLNSLTFPEAVSDLARKTGVVLREHRSSPDRNGEGGIPDRLSRINILACDFFQNHLQAQAGKGAREYLKTRGIRDETVKTFSLGHAPAGWRSLRDFLAARKIPPDLASRAGVLVSKDGDYYDRFRDRVIFPIANLTGETVAFGGRILGEGEPKYLNSPETPLYSKGKNLFGIHQTREAIRKKDEVILVEGYFDLLSLWNAGIQNVAATLGTALTEDQVRLIKRLTSRVIIIFDPDPAGRKALERGLDLFLAAGIQARIVILPPGYDPDAHVRAFGAEKTAALIENASSLVDYYIDEVIGEKTTFEEKSELIRRAVPFMGKIGDPLKRELFIKRVSERLSLDLALLKREIKQAMSPVGVATRPPRKAPPPKEEEMPELRLLQVMLEYPARIKDIYTSAIAEYFAREETRTLARALYDYHSDVGPGRFDASTFLDSISDEVLRKTLLASVIDPFPFEEDKIDQVVGDIMKQIVRKWYREKRLALGRKLAAAEGRADRDECRRLLEDKSRLIGEEKEAFLAIGMKSRRLLVPQD